MKNTIFFILALLTVLFFLPTDKSSAATPSWVKTRPISRDFFIGIGVCNKKEFKEDCRKVAEDKAFYELSSEISVDITGSFVQKIVERTGLSEQEVRSEIRTSSRARLTGHELAGEWEDRKNHWVYFRLSRQEYLRQRTLEKERAVAAAVDMLDRAVAAKKGRDAVSALRFYFEALARVEDFIGDNIQTLFQGRSVFLFNEIYANIQLIMADVRLTAGKNRMPAFIGEPLHEPISVVATLKNENGKETGLAGLPIIFNFTGEANGLHQDGITSDQGLAGVTLARVTAADHGRTLSARVDVDRLCPDKDTRGFFRALINRLTIPEAGVVIHAFDDKDTYYWHREFEGKKVVILSAYQTKESSAKWTKIGDELLTFIQSKGASSIPVPATIDIQNTINLSADSNVPWADEKMQDVDIIFVLTAVGKLNQRENAKNPFGEDVQFAGEIRTSVHKSEKLFFSDRYKGATGWNPMGEDMVMDVLALHVFKRWQQQYLKQLQN